MGRWLAPLMGVLGLLALVAGVAWAELDEGSMPTQARPQL